MTLRKLFAWLMTLVMLLGMVPAAHAELAGCNHDLDSGKWLRGEPQNCLDWKPKTYTCTICGATATNEECGPCVPGNKTWVVPQASNCQEHGVWEITCKYCGEWLEGMEEPGPHKYETKVIEQPSCTISGWKSTECSYCGSEQSGPVEIPALGHDWGNWSWAHGSAPSCTEGAWQVRNCNRCGRMEDKWVGAGSHQWGSWNTVSAGNCQTPAKEQRSCSVCGVTETRSTAMGDHKWGEWKTTKPGTCVQEGEEQRSCSVCGKTETRSTGGGGHKYGEYKTVKEPTCVEQGRKEHYCEYCGSMEWGSIPMIDHSFTEWYTVLLPAVGVPGLEERKCTMCGLTEERETPALDPETGKLEGGLDFVNGSVVPDNGDDHVNEYPPITLEKFIRNTPANGEYFVPGEVLNYALTLRIPDDLYIDDAAIYDPITGDNLPVISYGKGLWASMGIDVFHTVTEEDAARGYVENTAYATWFYQTTGEAGRCDSNTVTVPCGEEELPDDYQVPASFTYQIINTDAPVNGSHYVPGELISFKSCLTNTSDSVTLIVDKTAFASTSGNGTFVIRQSHHTVLEPGESLEWSHSNLVTEQNMTLGYIERIDNVYLTDEYGVEHTATDSIRFPCGPGELPDDYVPPVNPDIDEDGIPNEEDPDIDGDGIPNEEDPDVDGDGIPNGSDPDVDGDGIPNEKDPDYQPAAGLTVDMTYTNTPANGSFFTPGEVIDYLITVTNTGDVPLTSLQVGNSSSEAVVPAPSEIAPGQTIQVPYYKLVYEGDAKAGGISSYAHANAFNGDPALPESLVSGRSADVFVPCGMGDGTPSVYYLKIVANAPANGLYFTEGETIRYRLSFGNNTDKAIYNITLTDPMANAGALAFADSLQAGEFLMGQFDYVVTAADVAAGRIVNTATSSWAAEADGDYSFTDSNTVVTPTSGDQHDESAPDAILEKYVSNTPANGEYFVPGETIEYAVIFMNCCPHELHDVEVYDPLKGSNEDITITREPIVEPNGTLYLNFSYVVTEEDAARGTVVNTASALWLNPEIEEWSSCDSNTVVTETGMPVVPIQVTKAVANTPSNGEYFVIGETVEFSITVTNNTGKELTGMIITDPLDADWICEINELLLPGESHTEIFSYVVTELDAAAGSVENYANVRIIEADGYRFLTSNVVVAPCWYYNIGSMNNGQEYPIFSGTIVDTPFGIITGLEVTKAVESLPLNGLYYTEGETVAYRITYVNSGETPLTDVMIYDSLAGMTEIASAETLAVGESRWCTFNYTVTAADVDRGYIPNTAMGQFEINGYLNTVYSDTVVVDTDGQSDPEIPEGILPPSGVIDVSKQNNDQYCHRVTSSRTNVSYSWGTSFCSDHANIQGNILMMEQAATTPEMQMQTANYAVALWRDEVDKLYEELLGAADLQARAVIMAEYVSFLTHASNYETLLNAIYPDQPLVIAQKMVALWEEKCITLCQEMHMPVAARQDSFLAVEIATMEGISDACTCVTYDEGKGWNNIEQSYCPTHSFPFVMMDMLLGDQDTAEAWTTVRQIWQVELRSGYNKVIALLSENSEVALAEYATLENWMIAREAELTLLYPDNPELVAQTMVRIIINQVNILCQMAQ